MKKSVLVILFAVAGLAAAFADQFQVVRIDRYDGQGNLTSVSWLEWDYFNKTDLLYVQREGNTFGQEFRYKYIADEKMLYPFKKQVFVEKDPDRSNANPNIWALETTYKYKEYSKKEFLSLELRLSSSGQQETISFSRDTNGRTLEKRVSFDPAKEGAGTIVYTFTYKPKTDLVESLSGGGTEEKYSYDAKGALVKTEFFKNGQLDAVETYQYGGDKGALIVAKTVSMASGQTVSTEKYTYGLFKAAGVINKEISALLGKFNQNITAVEAQLNALSQVARNREYNDQMRTGFAKLANEYFNKEKYEEALRYYKKAIAFSTFNAAGTEEIAMLRKFFYSPWGAPSTKPESEMSCAYNAACALTYLERWDEALLWLDFACQIGYNDKQNMNKDRDLEYLRLMKKDDFAKIRDRIWKPKP
jgi:hypothetical protein